MYGRRVFDGRQRWFVVRQNRRSASVQRVIFAPPSAVTITARGVLVIRVATAELLAVATDERVAMIAGVLEAHGIALLSCSPEELLAEPLVRAAAHSRHVLIESRRRVVMQAEASVPWDLDARLRAGLQLFADSLPDCVVELRDDIGDLASPMGQQLAGGAHIVFVPWHIHTAVRESQRLAVCVYRWTKNPWQSRWAQVEDVQRRFDRQNEAWPRDDFSRYDLESMGAARRVVVAELRGESTFQAIAERRAAGRALGEVVGQNQAHGWLAADLRLEHFVATRWGLEQRRLANDVLLLRAPTPRERAACIVLLYQTLDYVAWRAFREGYLSNGGGPAIEALVLLEGVSVLHIATAHCGKRASQARGAGRYEEALRFCSIIDAVAQPRVGTFKGAMLQ